MFLSQSVPMNKLSNRVSCIEYLCTISVFVCSLITSILSLMNIHGFIVNYEWHLCGITIDVALTTNTIIKKNTSTTNATMKKMQQQQTQQQKNATTTNTTVEKCNNNKHNNKKM